MRIVFGGTIAAALLLGVVATAVAQSTQTGIVVRVDPQSRVVMLGDGRMYRVTPNTVVLVNNQPSPFTALAPGQRVVIQSGEMVMLQGGQYVTVAGPATVAQPTTVVTPAPATAVPVGVRQVLYGTVSSVDEDGEVEIKTERDSFEIKLAPEALRHVKKGDTVTLDLTISPGAPASPR